MVFNGLQPHRTEDGFDLPAAEAPMVARLMGEPGKRADELLRELGYESWRPGQREAVVAALEGRDSLIVMPTGGGKSLCY
jgi:ATP-dependent DNA helicase RecQ